MGRRPITMSPNVSSEKTDLSGYEAQCLERIESNQQSSTDEGATKELDTGSASASSENKCIFITPDGDVEEQGLQGEQGEETSFEDGGGQWSATPAAPASHAQAQGAPDDKADVPWWNISARLHVRGSPKLHARVSPEQKLAELLFRSNSGLGCSAGNRRTTTKTTKPCATSREFLGVNRRTCRAKKTCAVKVAYQSYALLFG